VVVTADTSGEDGHGDTGGSEEDGNDDVEPNVTVTGDLVAGGKITVGATGLQADTAHDVYLHSEPALLAQETSDDRGAFTASATIPEDTAAGKHRVTVETEDGNVVASVEIAVATAHDANDSAAAGTAPEGGSDAASGDTADTTPVADADDASSGSGLAQTGFQIGGLVLAVLVIALGVVLMLIRRRKGTRS
jgi:cobalamin biosynthesis Mg chelatase CobN